MKSKKEKLTHREIAHYLANEMKTLFDVEKFDYGELPNQAIIAFAALLRESRKSYWSQIIPADGWYAVHRMEDEELDKEKLMCWGIETESTLYEHSGGICGVVDLGGFLGSPAGDSNFVGYYHESEDWEKWKKRTGEEGA